MSERGESLLYRHTMIYIFQVYLNLRRWLLVLVRSSRTKCIKLIQFLVFVYITFIICVVSPSTLFKYTWCVIQVRHFYPWYINIIKPALTIISVYDVHWNIEIWVLSYYWLSLHSRYSYVIQTCMFHK